MHSPRGQGIESPLGAPHQETAQIRVRMITGGTRESGQVGSHRQPQRIGSSHEVSRSDRADVGKSLHDQDTARRCPQRIPQAHSERGMTGRRPSCDSHRWRSLSREWWRGGYCPLLRGSSVGVAGSGRDQTTSLKIAG